MILGWLQKYCIDIYFYSCFYNLLKEIVNFNIYFIANIKFNYDIAHKYTLANLPTPK